MKNWKTEQGGKAAENRRVFEGVQLFFARLLAPLVFAGLPRFCLAAEGFRGALTLGLAIGGVELTEGEVAVGFSRCLLWKVLTILRRCWMADAGSQVFSSSG